MESFELKSLVDSLKNEFKKVYYEDQSDYYLFLIESENSSHVLCLTKTLEKYIYGKIVALSQCSYLDCDSIIYSAPSGLYVYAKSLEEFMKKLVDKINLLTRRQQTVIRDN